MKLFLNKCHNKQILVNNKSKTTIIKLIEIEKKENFKNKIVVKKEVKK